MFCGDKAPNATASGGYKGSLSQCGCIAVAILRRLVSKVSPHPPKMTRIPLNPCAPGPSAFVIAGPGSLLSSLSGASNEADNTGPATLAEHFDLIPKCRLERQSAKRCFALLNCTMLSIRVPRWVFTNSGRVASLRTAATSRALTAGQKVATFTRPEPKRRYVGS
jgi:hypothetical protein